MIFSCRSPCGSLVSCEMRLRYLRLLNHFPHKLEIIPNRTSTQNGDPRTRRSMATETNSFPSSSDLQQDDRRSHIPPTGRQNSSVTRVTTCMMSLVVVIKPSGMTKNTDGTHSPPSCSMPDRRLGFHSWAVKGRVQLQFKKAYARLPALESRSCCTISQLRHTENEHLPRKTFVEKL